MLARHAIILAACILGFFGAIGFYLIFAPSETPPTPTLQADYGQILPDAPEPTPVPTPAPTPTPTPIAGEKETLIALTHTFFPDDEHMGNVVVWEESLKRADWWDYVYGGVFSVTGDCGLMQINWASHPERFLARGWDQQDCFEPEKNLTIAREIYNEQGPVAWTTY